jgi:tRNA pseudouridine55 synthase
MKKVITTNKNIGETPLEALERVRKEKKIDSKTPMTYAGRLDPMAEGELLILVGDECKNKEKYLGLDKEYEVEVLFGIETDTQDVLGLIKRINVDNIQRIPGKWKDPVKDINFEKYEGKFTQEYPIYSSKMIAMKEAPEEMPTKDVEIYSIEKLDEREISGIEIAESALEKIAFVTGEFRQGDIGEEWAAFGEEFGNFPFKIITLKVKCSSGTYMRSLAERIGKDVGAGAFAYSIKRTAILS